MAQPVQLRSTKARVICPNFDMSFVFAVTQLSWRRTKIDINCDL